MPRKASRENHTASAAKSLRKGKECTPIERWMSELHGFNEENAWRYLVAVDRVITKAI